MFLSIIAQIIVCLVIFMFAKQISDTYMSGWIAGCVVMAILRICFG